MIKIWRGLLQFIVLVMKMKRILTVLLLEENDFVRARVFQSIYIYMYIHFEISGFLCSENCMSKVLEVAINIETEVY